MKVAKIGLAGLFAVLGVLSASASANETVTYTYDALGRLVATSVSGTAPTNGQNVTTSFDPTGNRSNYAVCGVGGAGCSSSTISIGNASTTEGATLNFTVTRSGTTNTAVSASYSTSGGTATSGSDFTPASGTVSFAANETSKTISIATIDDTATEPTEAMAVALLAPSSGATITTATGGGTISDNDTLINITDANLNVLAPHASTYGCSIGLFWEICWINSSGVAVYDPFFSWPPTDVGYSISYPANGLMLSVQPAYYGTGVAP